MHTEHGYEISSEASDDVAEIESLIEGSFGSARKTRTVYRFRDGVAPLSEFCFVVRHDGARQGESGRGGNVVGSVRFWPVRLPDAENTVVPLLGPLAIDPALRGYGLGRALVRHGLDAVREAGFPAVLIIGDPGYYAPFEFSVQPVAGMDVGGPVTPLTLMGIEFRPGSLSGVTGTITPVRQNRSR